MCFLPLPDAKNRMGVNQMEHDLCYGCMEHTGAQNTVCPACGFDPANYVIEPHQLKPGTVLRDRYAVGRVLGEGGFGITYVGRDTVLDLKVAIKEFYMTGYVNRNNTYSTVVQASMGTHAETFEKNREKFLQEARVLAKFSTEAGIVGIRDYFQENNTAYIVMEFLSGETLRDYLNRVGPISWSETHSILQPVLRSLGNVHNHSVIHRDISPDNIMLLGDGQVKLLDFGAAREISKNDIKSLSVILKPGYAPEEQYRSKGMQGPWTDIYALCATMYRCLTGIVPEDSMDRMYEDRLKSPAELCGCPIAISNVLMRGLAVRQPDRYRSIDELCADIALAEADPSNPAIAAPKAPAVSADDGATVYAGGGSTAVATDTDSTVFVDTTGGNTAGDGNTKIPGQEVTRIPGEDSDKKDSGGKKKGGKGNKGKDSKGSKAPKDPQDPNGRPKKGIGKFLLIGAAALIIVILLVSLLKGGGEKAPSGVMPAALSDLSVTLNDTDFYLPMMFDTLTGEGWMLRDETVWEKKVAPNTAYGGYVTLENGYGELMAYYCNPTNSTLTVKDCAVYKLYLTTYSFIDDYMNEGINSAALPCGLELSEATASEFRSRYSGYGTEKSILTEYYYSAGSSSEYRVGFNDDNVLTMISITADVPEDFIQNTYSKKAPKYDKDAYEAAVSLPWELTLIPKKLSCAASISVEELEDLGWEIEKAPEFVPSRSSETVYMRYDALHTLEVQIVNPFDEALVPEHCMVSKIYVSFSNMPTGDEPSLLGIHPADNAEISLTPAMTLEDTKKALTDCGIYFEVQDACLYIYPHGEGDSRYVALTFYSSGDRWLSVQMNVQVALRDFR